MKVPVQNMLFQRIGTSKGWKKFKQRPQKKDILAYLGASSSASWSCSNFLLTLLDFPLSIMAISISVSSQLTGKSQCSPSALSIKINESQVSSFTSGLFLLLAYI